MPDGRAADQTKSVPADDVREISMGAVWGAAFFVVAVVGGVLTPWDALADLLVNQGVSDEGSELLAFVAGFTLPLAAGTAIIAFAALRGLYRDMPAPAVAAVAAGVLAATGYLSGELGLGLAPDLGTHVEGGDIYAPLVWTISPYLSTYGWSLMICGIAIGIAVALQVEPWTYGEAA